MTNEPCVACNRHHGVDGYNPVHPYRVAGSRVQLEPDDDANAESHAADKRIDVHMQRLPFDPVLRDVLITKGIVTIDELRDAEAKIMVVSGQMRKVMRDDDTTA